MNSHHFDHWASPLRPRRDTTRKRPSPTSGEGPSYRVSCARLEANVRAEIEPAAVGVVNAATERTSGQHTRGRIRGRVDAGARRCLVEQVLHTEAEPDVVVQLIGALQAEQVVRR